MIRAAIAWSISAGLLALGGCARQPLPIGTFRGVRSVPTQPGTDPVVADQLGRVLLKINADGKAILEDGGMPWELQVRREGDRLEAEVLAVSGINVAKSPGLPRQLEFTVKTSGDLAYGPVLLHRE